MIMPTDRIFRAPLGEQQLTVASQFRSGSDELIVFLHGYACSKELFHRAWSCPELAQYSMLCPDFVGFGDSGKPDNFPYTIEAHAAVLEELLKKVEAASLHIVAHSMGGAIALLLPQDRIDTLASFANVEGSLLSDPSLADTQRKPRLPRNQEDLTLLRQAQSAASDTALRRTGKSLTQWSGGGELLARFQSAKCPKAYFYGDDLGELRLKSELRDCNPIQIPDASHFVMNDNPSVFYDQLAQFIEAKQEAPANK